MKVPNIGKLDHLEQEMLAKLRDLEIPSRAEEFKTARTVLDLIQHLRDATEDLAYLTECCGATVESLPKSTSKLARVRHEAIFKKGVEMVRLRRRMGVRAPLHYSGKSSPRVEAAIDVIEDSIAKGNG